jgi:hypothetical protein
MDWITISKNTGDGSNEVLVTLSPGTVARTGRVIGVDEDGNTDVVEIREAGNPPYLCRVDGNGTVHDGGMTNVFNGLYTDGVTMNFGASPNTPAMDIRPKNASSLEYNVLKIGLNLAPPGPKFQSGTLLTMPIGENSGLRIDINSELNAYDIYSFEYDDPGNFTLLTQVGLETIEEVELRVVQVSTPQLGLRIYENDNLLYDMDEWGTWDFSQEEPIVIGYHVIEGEAFYPPYGVLVRYFELDYESE